MLFMSADALATAKVAPALVTPIVPNTQDQLIQVSLALVVVLALIYAIAWFIKRNQGMQGVSNIPMKTIGALPMGMKEKIILVEIGGKQLLLGMTPSNINTLAVFDEPVITSAPEPVSFSKKLKDIISQQKNTARDQGNDTKAQQDD